MQKYTHTNTASPLHVSAFCCHHQGYSTKNCDKQCRIIILHVTRIILHHGLRTSRCHTFLSAFILMSISYYWSVWNAAESYKMNAKYHWKQKVISSQFHVSSKWRSNFVWKSVNLSTYIVDPRILRRWSTIFLNMGIFFVVGDTADWAWHDTYGLSFLKLWYRFALVMHLCHKFRAIIVVAPVIICAIEEQEELIRSLISWKCTSCWNIENNASALREQSCVTTGCLRMDWEFQNGHTGVRHEEWAGPTTEGKGAYMGCLSAQNVSFWGHKECYAKMNQVNQKWGVRNCKVIHLLYLYTYYNNC